MSAIIRYKCSKDCGKWGVSLRAHFPLWSEDAPKEKRKMPVSMGNEKFVVGYASEKACLSCMKIVEIVERERIKPPVSLTFYQKAKNFLTRTKPQEWRYLPPICPKCGTGDRFLTIGAKCHRCGDGEVVEDASARVMF